MSEAVVERLVALGLGTLDDRTQPIAIAADEVTALLSSAPHDGVVALLGAAIDTGTFVVDEGSQAAIDAAWSETMARCVQLDALLRDASRRLTSAGIDHRVLKGAAVAQLDELHPAWRSYSDVDLLVPDGSLIAAVRALSTMQLRPLVAPVSERWAERFAKSLTLVGPDGAQVDLHRQLTPGVFGERLDAVALFRNHADVTVGDTTVRALGAPHRFLHACYHASLGGVQGPRHRRDILLLAAVVSVGDLSTCWAEGWSPTVVADALTFARGGGAPMPGEWAEWLQSCPANPDDEALLATYTGAFGDQARASVRARAGWARVQYVWPLLWPSANHLRSRGVPRVRHLRSVWRARTARSRRSPS